jgi:hypothetical protein
MRSANRPETTAPAADMIRAIGVEQQRVDRQHRSRHASGTRFAVIGTVIAVRVWVNWISL